ncbi:MAG: flagellar biosynthesis protein FliQ [Pseudomonadota bacterium]
MTLEVALDIFREAMNVIILLVMAIVTPGLVVGLIVAIFQAATSINEQTLSFLPRLVITLLSLTYFGHWIWGTLISFSDKLVRSIPYVIG